MAPPYAADPGTHSPTRLRLLLSGAIVLAGFIAFRGALVYFFSQDDFSSLARAAGMLPRLQGPWRYLGNQAIFDLLRPIAGLHPLPYHLASLVVHLACSVLVLAVLLEQRASMPGAFTAAVFIAVHPVLFTAVYWISVIADGLSLLFALGTLMAANQPGRRRWLAVPLFALSLLSKESTLLLPVVVAVMLSWNARADRESGLGRVQRIMRDPLPWVLAGISAIYLVYFVSSAYGTYFLSPTGSSHPGLPAEALPYSMGLGAHVWKNLLTYAGWTVNFLLPTVKGFTDAIDPMVFPWGILAILIWTMGLAIKPLRDAGWLEGGLIYLCLLAPVLPLRNHTYHYYLYAPMFGAAWCVSSAIDAVFFGPARRHEADSVDRHTGRAGAGRRRRPAIRVARREPTWAWVIAAVLTIGLTLNGALLIHENETYPFIVPELRSDPIVDRARIAENVCHDLRTFPLPPGVRLIFWSPFAIQMQRSTGRDPRRESYWERNVRQALLGGLAVRLFFPQVREVHFVRSFQPVDNSSRYAVYGIDGHLRVATSGELAAIVRGAPERP